MYTDHLHRLRTLGGEEEEEEGTVAVLKIAVRLFTLPASAFLASTLKKILRACVFVINKIIILAVFGQMNAKEFITKPCMGLIYECSF